MNIGHMLRTLAVVVLSLGAWDRAAAAGTVEYGKAAPSLALGRPLSYAIYLPSATPPSGERWPVVYLLHGYTGVGSDWFTLGNLAPILDKAIAEGRIKPMVVVAPSAGDF